MGDSLTAGVDYYTVTASGYRDPLCHDLAPYLNFTFVGAVNNTGTNTRYLNSKNQEANNGYGGYEIIDLYNNLDGNVAPVAGGDSNQGGYWITGGGGTGRGANTPNILLLQIGANDFIQGSSASTAETNLHNLVTKFHTLSPNTIILVAAIPPFALDTGLNPTVQAYNSYIQNTLVPSLSYTRFVDNYNIFISGGAPNTLDFGTDNGLGVHPNRYGYPVMAASWARAIFSLEGINPTTYALTVNNGTANNIAGGSSYPAGTIVTVNSNPPSGNQFSYWSPSNTLLDNPYWPIATYTMPAAASSVTANYAATNSPSIPNGTYEIVGGPDDFQFTYSISPTGLSIGAASAAAGQAVQLQNYSGGSTQQWVVNNLGSNVVELYLPGTNLALSVVGASTTAGAYLDVENYTGASSQQWTLTQILGTTEIVNVNSGMAINITGYNGVAGQQLDQYNAGYLVNQVWAFFLVSGGGGSAPSAPTGLTATPGNAQVGLSWTAATGATSYTIYRGTSSGNETTTVATGVTGTSYSDSGLTNGTMYYYRITATNSYGTSGYSNEASATPTAGVSIPSAPTNLVATPSNAQAALSWTASAGAASYTLYRGTSSGNESTTVATGITATSYNDSGLTNGTTYYYKVTATNSAGTSGYSNEASTTPTAGGGSQQLIGLQYQTNGSASIGSLSAGVVAQSGWNSSVLNYVASGTYSVNNLLTSTGTASGISESTTCYGGYDHPNGGGFASGTGNYALFGGYALGSYGGVPNVTLTLSGLSASTTYTLVTYVVSSSATDVISATTNVSGSPTYYIKGSVSNTLTQGTATTPAAAAAGNYFQFSSITGVTSLTYTLTDTGSGTVGLDGFQIVANSGGGGSAPSAPTGLTATPGNAQVGLNWTASSGATSYTIYRGTSSGNETTMAATGVTGTSYTDAGLTNGTMYYYRITATNSSGTSGYSNEASATPTAGVSIPSAPTNLTATPGNAQVGLSWTASAGATSYTIYRGTSSGNESTTVATGVTATTYTNTGLTNGTTYYYKVTATNSAGTSGYSNEASATPTSGVSIPAAPTGLTATPGNAQVSLSWTASAGATSYSIYRGTSSGNESTTVATGVTATTYLDSSLTNGTAYYYKVTATNSAGTSGYSNEASATPASSGGGTASIGMQFQGLGTALAVTDAAGLSTVAQTNWNVSTASSFSSLALKDSTGASTTATLSGSANGAYFASSSTAPPATGNNKLASGELYNTWPSPPTLTVSGIPYASYDVYVYAAIDSPGRYETCALTPSGGSARYYSFTTSGGGSAWTVATSTWNGSGTAPSLPTANLVHYTNLTAASFTLACGAPNNGGINGIQIVPNTASGTAPSITMQPGNQSVTVGQTATFNVTAAGTSPFTYQWSKNGTAISGATSSAYTTPATVSGDNGSTFNVKVTNAYGNVTSNSATLTVSAAATGAISLQFQGQGTALTAGISAGVSTVAQPNWNVVTGNSFSNIALVNSAGSSTTAVLNGSASTNYFAGGSSASPAGNATMASGEIVNGFPGGPTLTISGIPYAKYDVYIYASIDAPGRSETMGLTPSGGAASYFSFTTEGSTSSWVAATSTWNGTGTQPSLPTANLVHYTGLTATSFTLNWGAPGNGGINGIEIVPTQ